ncbi:MAG TPA: DUF308 domain-containing protein [Mucilaginibacter sp.]|jgi:uncharacterized membrane protein HdeD (DUF308 family)|nr:DUF308 domain-containing protein [Mucilaginibacter sp.]
MEVAFNKRLRHWWAFLIYGLLFILFGIYLVAAPASGFATLGFLFGLVILLSGVTELIRVISDTDAFNRGFHLIMGIIDVILGIILITHIAASETIMRIVVGIWFLFRGIAMLSFSGFGRRSWLMIFGGIIIIIAAIFILFNPAFGAITIILWTAFAFIITGIMNLALAFRLRQFER